MLFRTTLRLIVFFFQQIFSPPSCERSRFSCLSDVGLAMQPALEREWVWQRGMGWMLWMCLCDLVWPSVLLSSAWEEYVLGIHFSFVLDLRMHYRWNRPESCLYHGSWPSAEPQSHEWEIKAFVAINHWDFGDYLLLQQNCLIHFRYLLWHQIERNV